MRKWSIIAAVTGFAVFVVAELVHDSIKNDPIGYFASEPHQLLYVAGIAIVGGFIALGYYRLPLCTQKRVRMICWGAAATIATAGVCYFAFIFFSLISMISNLGGSVWTVVVVMMPALPLLAIVAAYCWVACWRVWKRGASHDKMAQL